MTLRRSIPWSNRDWAPGWRFSVRWSKSDLVGLDLTLDIANVLYPHLDRTAGPHPFLQAKVDNGHLGMETGEGFRKWSPLEADAVRAELSRFLVQKAKR